MSKLCDHLTAISDIRQPKQHVCEECVKTKSQWVHLSHLPDVRRNALLR